MNGELLSILEAIEREKGIKREILVSAVEQALLLAARKVVGEQPDLVVKLDSETGRVRIFSGEEEVISREFGRIAAQTAKQVIIQKIREAERDVIYSDYSEKVTQLVNGLVHQLDRGNLVVDLGKAEGFLPKREQSPHEEFRQGDRVKCYVLEVRKTAKGPQIILTRSHPGFVRRLFELEVPEINEGIVEIKAIAREAGERTKVAVSSKDEKVDSVGSCVGMRGSRVKNIVRELRGEKVDIVRWSEDLQEYVKAALGQINIAEIRVDKPRNTVEVIVEDDQLSMAIGKKGQNVRLASRIIGWEIDIRSKSMMAKVKEIDLTELPGVGEKTKEALIASGFTDVYRIAVASLQALMEVKGIGDKSAEKLQAAAKAMVDQLDVKKARLEEGQAPPAEAATEAAGLTPQAAETAAPETGAPAETAPSEAAPSEGQPEEAQPEPQPPTKQETLPEKETPPASESQEQAG